MRVRFAHLADLHLGYEQYHSPERYRDFFQTFHRAVSDILKERVDFVLIAGDLFHQRVISPLTLILAQRELQRLKEAGIPVVGVMGNHEQPHYRQDHSWLDFLSAQGLLILLRPYYQDEKLVLQPYQDGAGGYVDLEDVRIYGTGYHGAAAPRVFADLTARLEELHAERRPPFTILLAHAEVEGMLVRGAGTRISLTHYQLAPLRPHIDYLALGHVHKPAQQDGWLFNPGSLEPNNFDESQHPGGVFFVEVEIGRPHTIRAEHRRYARRPFIRRRLDVTPFQTPEELYDALRRQLQADAEQFPMPPVVEFSLDGLLHFPSSALQMDMVAELIRQRYQPLVSQIHLRAAPAEYVVNAPAEHLSRAEMEQQVMRELLQRDGRFQGSAEQWAGLFRELKERVLERQSADEIIRQLRLSASSLLDEGMAEEDVHHAG